MTIIRDNINVNQGWEETGAWTDSNKSISGGAITISGGSNYKTKGWTKTGLVGLNVIISASFTPIATFHQLHVRAESATKHLLCYTNGSTFYLAKTDPSLVSFATGAIVNYNASKTYIMELMVFGDMLIGTLYDENGDVNVQLIERSATIAGFTGTKTGLSAATSATYYDIAGRVLNTFHNVVCFGDSNTEGVKVEDWEAFPQVIQKKRRVEDLKSINAGISGNKVADLIARQAADVDIYLTDGAQNVCVVFIGTNNYLDVAADVWAEMQTLITNLKAAGWQVFFCTYPHSFNDRVAFINDLYNLVSAGVAGEGATLIDIFIAFGCTTGGTRFVTPGLLTDGDALHFSAAGNSLVSRETLKQVRNNERTPLT